jgi:hypothetical protein
MAKEKIQMVDDDEVENVGIMAGFMDDFEDVLEEMMGEEAEMEEGDDADMANMMNRRPDSPEILMNNLRGDIRSLDARREELADLVGYNAASETPEGVLALLQPILAQQQAAAAMPPMMPPMMPPVAAPGTLPAGSSMPPADAGGIASLPVDQGPAPMAMAMAKGGYVQHFQEGSGEAGVTPAEDPYGAYPPEIVEAAKARVLALMSQQPAELPDVQARAAELYPEYEAMLGSGRDAAQAQMLFDIGQAALQYAGNVGPGGQPLRGSQAARLAGAVSQLPGKIGATAAGMSKEARTLKLAAMQAAEKERATAEASNLALAEQQADLYKEIAKQKTSRLLTPEEITSMGLDAELPWQIDQAGKISIAGGRPPAPVVDMGENTLERVGVAALVEGLTEQYNAALDATGNIRKIDETIKLLEEGDVDTGFGAEFRQNIRKVQSLFADDPSQIERLSDTELLNSALGKEVFGAISALGVGARGLDTPAEREFLREVVAGRITLTKETLLEMARIRRRAEENSIMRWNDTLASGRADALVRASQGMLSDQPLPIPTDPITGERDESSDVRSRVNELLGR